MSLEGHPDLAAQIDRLAERASLDYQRFQLAAQRADIEGHSLAAGVLRSISESQAGKAHALLTFVQPTGAFGEKSGDTSDFVRSAAARAGEVEQLSAALLEQARAELDARGVQDLEAIVHLTATNRQRLERLLAGLAAG